MAARRRYTYRLDLTSFTPAQPTDAPIRQPALEDLDALAELMLSAYRGTIDDDGETLEDARQEVRGYLSGPALLEMSTVAETRTGLISACLVNDWAGVPLIAYIMTQRDAKARGWARRLLADSLGRLKAQGNETVAAVITEGNEPSERLFLSLGFVRDD